MIHSWSFFLFNLYLLNGALHHINRGGRFKKFLGSLESVGVPRVQGGDTDWFTWYLLPREDEGRLLGRETELPLVSHQKLSASVTASVVGVRRIQSKTRIRVFLSGGDRCVLELLRQSSDALLIQTEVAMLCLTEYSCVTHSVLLLIDRALTLSGLPLRNDLTNALPILLDLVFQRPDQG